VLDARVYRAAFLPALLALFVVAFALEDRPRPAHSPLRAEGFDGARAFAALEALGRAFPERPPGSAGDAGLADRVAAELAGNGFRVRRAVDSGTTLAGSAPLETVTGVRPGLSDRRIVVLAHRDAAGRGGLAELSGTAALLELARVYRTRLGEREVRGERAPVVGRELRKTLVLVSTSGGSAGAAGARAWARGGAGGPVDAVLVLGDLASRRAQRPWVVPWSADDRPVALRLQRTVEAAVRAEAATEAGGARATAQWLRRAVPFTVGEQGPVAAAGLPAVLLSVSGERGPAAGAPVAAGRLDALGRAALRSVSAVDASRRGALDGPAGIVALRNVVPDWSVRLLVGTLLLPALLAALDAVARARRQRLPLRAAAVRLGLVTLGGLVLWGWLRLLGVVGLLDAPPAPVPARAASPSDADLLAAGSVVLLIALAALLARGRRPRSRGRGRSAAGRRFARPVARAPAPGGAAAVGGLALCLLVAVVWVANPHAAALLLPAAHLWLLAGAWRGRAAAVAVLAGLLPLALVVLYGATAIGADPWVAVLAVAGGHVSPWTAIVLAALLGCLLAVLRGLARGPAPAPPAAPAARITTRGPLSYAGPGSLGGTESALRR